MGGGWGVGGEGELRSPEGMSSKPPSRRKKILRVYMQCA